MACYCMIWSDATELASWRTQTHGGSLRARTAVKSVQVHSALDLRRDGSTKTPQPNDFLSVFFDIEGPPMMIMWLKTVVHSGGGKWSLIIDMSAGEHSAREAPTWAMSS